MERGKQTLTDWLKSQHPDSMLQRTALHQVRAWLGEKGGGRGADGRRGGWVGGVVRVGGRGLDD